MELLVADNCPGTRWGQPRMVFEISRGLAQRGCIVDIAYSEPDDLLGEYSRFCRSLTPVTNLTLDRAHSLSSSLGLVRSIGRARREHHDVIYLHHPSHDVFGVGLGLAQRARVVCHLHHAPPRRFGWSNVVATPRISRFLAVSDHLKRSWVAAGLDPASVEVVRNGVDPDRYAPGDSDAKRRGRAAWGIAPQETVVLFAGRLHPSKGAHVLAEAVSRLGRPDWRLILAGPVDPRPSPQAGDAYRQSLLRLGPSGGTVITGLLSDLVPLYRAADVVVVPTEGDEGLPQVLLEAMSCGTPVLASRVGGIPEVLNGELARLLFTPGDVLELVSRLDQLEGWAAREPALGALCREHVRRHFNLGSTIQAVDWSLREALGVGRAHRLSASRRRLVGWSRIGVGAEEARHRRAVGG